MSALIICFQEVLASPYNIIKLLYSPSQHLIKTSNSYRDSLIWILASSITIINYNQNWRLSRECGTRRCLGSYLWFIIFWKVQDLLKLPSVLLVFSLFFFNKKWFLKCIAGKQRTELTNVEVFYSYLNTRIRSDEFRGAFSYTYLLLHVQNHLF